VNDYSSYCWSYFLKRKVELASKLVGLIKKLKSEKIRVVFLRLDDAALYQNKIGDMVLVDVAGIRQKLDAPRHGPY
jgi:hypothetical protein